MHEAKVATQYKILCLLLTLSQGKLRLVFYIYTMTSRHSGARARNIRRSSGPCFSLDALDGLRHEGVALARR